MIKNFLKKYKVIKEIWQIRRSRLFDCSWYLMNYSDVSNAKIDPIKHYVLFGWKEGRNPSASFNTNGYLYAYKDVKLAGMNPLIHYIRHGKAELRNTGLTGNYGSAYNDSAICRPTVSSIIKEKKQQIRPFEFIKVNSDEIRINLVTDSIGSASLLGGVGTAIIIVTLLANRNNWILRIHTRNDKNDALAYYKFLKFMGISSPRKVEFTHDCEFRNSSKYRLEVSGNDVFFATSWWSAYGIKSCNLRKRFFGIIQEEETFFYPYSDERLWCETIMKDDTIDFVINSKYLYDYFKNSGYSNIVNNGKYFEPAFPNHIYSSDKFTFEKKEKYKLFFYSRPNNHRNLFYTGLEMLDNALLLGILNCEEWEIVLAGSDVPEFEFSCGLKPIILGRMSWINYSNFARTVDLSFSLMYTPHPSYPPLDMAASGAVVLSNKYANKKDMSSYSENIILKELLMEDMLIGFKEAVKLVEDKAARENNYINNNISCSWESNLEECLENITEKIRREY